MISRPIRLLVIVAALIPSTALAQLDDEDFPPGLLARYSVAEKTVERVDADVSFIWGEDTPDVRLPSGSFSAKWNGNLLMRREAKYTFHAYVQGRVRVTVDGKSVLEASEDKAGWATGKEISLGFGETPLMIDFTKTGKSARLQLFWSSDSFGLEPLPAHLLFREESSKTIAQIEKGRIAFDSHRCNRCHVRKLELPSPAAPALTHVAAGLSEQHLIEQLLDPDKASAHSRMPTFGFDNEQAKAVAAFLVNQSKPLKLQSPGKTKEKDRKTNRRAGQVLLRSVGCLACHTSGKQGKSGPWGGGDLTNIGAKRSPAWLNSWLSDPAKLNADHRMPNMKLTTTERRQLVLFLAQDSEQSSPAAGDKSIIAAGRQLVETARCAACHTIDGLKANVADMPDLSQPIEDWSQTCITARPDLKIGRPLYTAIDHEAVTAYVKSRTGSLSPAGSFARGQQVLEQRSCLACHPRGGAKGIVNVAGQMARVDSELQGKSQGLIPPALNSVGDKLLDRALVEAVSGDRKDRRLPWLSVRMPRFKHSKEEKRDLQAYLIGHDRIPADAPAAIAFSKPAKTDNSQTLVDGHSLVGPKGFSCIACHQVGSYTPRNVALGTRGSDLMALGKHMRREFYIRWTRAPARIVPGMEMPSYVKAAPKLLDEDIDRQLAATWDALNDPKFTPPTDPSSVEQFWVVKPGERARIVRDVFTNPKENGGGYIPRAFAIGLNNGHNMLFDLNTFSLRAWTVGDFARQRTQGKSWFWDMAGVPVMTGFQPASDFALLPMKGKNKKLIFPTREHGTNGRMTGYVTSDGYAMFLYRVPFTVNGKVHLVDFIEDIRPIRAAKAGERAGWTREVTVIGPNRPGGNGSFVTDDHHVLISRPATKSPSGVHRIEASHSFDGRWELFPAAKGREFIKMKVIAPDGNPGPIGRMAQLRYTSSLKLESGELKTKPADPPKVEKVTSVPGYDGVRLPISRAIMPTAMTFTPSGKLAFTSLKGDVYIAEDSNGDGVQDKLTLFEEGLASPFGIIADGDDLIVAHKPEVLLLRDKDGDGRADQRVVVATGWGYNENYHDWATGIVRDKQRNLYIGLGSDYAQKTRPKEQSRWRGKVLKIAPDGKITPVGHSFRYPTGLAINPAGEIFVTDNQGVQNTFNEINLLVPGRHYGVPSRHEPNPKTKAYPPAIQVPHPWSRSVNGLFFLPAQKPGFSKKPGFSGSLAGHGIGCEYDSRFLVRFTTQKVGDVTQGAVYYFSRPNSGVGNDNFVGPICGAVAPNGNIYIGNIYDSGWLGGQNTGAITRLRPNGKLPNGIRELRATADGFEIEFQSEIDRTATAKLGNYTISGYTRAWQGSYATPDSGRHRAEVTAAEVAEDGRSVRLKVNGLREGFVYEVSCGRIGTDAKTPLWPATGHYTLHQIPRN
ncbi:MAG: c-type cytochrome [Planctomycetaceae bacterium]|nr:c-type cytochrome [Planctomycetaceae bacterium]MBT6487678.1 c-type cytochrome [Planctomycetaceae bacterium]MBT6495714.1 c-type cytochrome [Planctomycetaceae bacterium]